MGMTIATKQILLLPFFVLSFTVILELPLPLLPVHDRGESVLATSERIKSLFLLAAKAVKLFSSQLLLKFCDSLFYLWVKFLMWYVTLMKKRSSTGK
jgi:hypothetical protein